jgi:hypothetical protein
LPDVRRSCLRCKQALRKDGSQCPLQTTAPLRAYLLGL